MRILVDILFRVGLLLAVFALMRYARSGPSGQLLRLADRRLAAITAVVAVAGVMAIITLSSRYQWPTLATPLAAFLVFTVSIAIFTYLRNRG